MSSVTVKTPDGAERGRVELDDRIFGIEPNMAVMHQVVTAQLAARRAGTQSTRTRAEVRGGGAKPWRQKGTGRARQGSIRAPHWRGGGVALGPKPRSYRQRTPKKMVRLALRSALSDRAAEGRVVVVAGWDFAVPRTRDAVAALAALGIDGRALIVLADDDVAAAKSFRNLPRVHVLAARELNAYDVLCADWVVFTEATLPTGTEADERRLRPAPAPQLAKTAPAPMAEEPASPAPVVADTEGAPTGAVEEEEVTDMADESLPTREKREKTGPPPDTGPRVASPGDKLDPRFEAARAKSERIEALQAQRAGAGDEAADAEELPAEPESAEESTTEDTTAEAPKKGFSFGSVPKPGEDGT